jgi:hypothetical protein
MQRPGADDEEPSPPHYLEGRNDKREEAEVYGRKKRRSTATPVRYKETDEKEEQVEQEEEEEDNRKWLRQQQKKKQRMLQGRALEIMTPHKSNNKSTGDEASHVGTSHPRHHQPPHHHHPVGVANPVALPPSVAYAHPYNYVNPMPTVPNILYGNPRPTAPNLMYTPHINPGAGTVGGGHSMPRPSAPLHKVPPLVAATNINAFPGTPKVSASTTDNALPDPSKVSNRKIQVQSLHKKKLNYKVKVKLLDNTVAAARNMGISDQIVEAVCREGGGFLKGSWICFHNPKTLDIKPNEFFQAIPRFDVSSLSPLPTEEVGKQWWKRVIELVCKQSNQPLVCFPSIRHACAALVLEPLQVQRACHTYGTHEQYDFHSYMLRYKIKSTAYVYGSHKPDFRQVQESHGERIARWNKVMAEKSKSKSAGGTKAPTPIAMRAPTLTPAPEASKVDNLESEETDTDTDESWSQSAAKRKGQTKKKRGAWEESGASKNDERRDKSDLVALSNTIAKRKESQMKMQKTREEPQESPQECGDWRGIEKEAAEPEAMIQRPAEPAMIQRPAESEMILRAAEPETIPRAVEPEMIVREPPMRLIPICPIQRPGSPRRDNILTETLELFSDAFTQRPERHPSRKCIFCQDTPAEIIFEPCGHSVVCKKCATWACSKYCPKCHGDIATRKLGTSIFRSVKLDLTRRPQIFSPYQFMDL